MKFRFCRGILDISGQALLSQSFLPCLQEIVPSERERMTKEAVAVLFLSHMVEQHTTNAPLPAAMGNFGVHSVLHLFNFTPIIGLVVVSNSRMN